MASFAGAINTLIRPDLFADLPGRTAGFGVPFHQPDFPFINKVPIGVSSSGIVTAGGASGGGGGGPGEVSHAGVTNDKLTFGEIWFEKIHALPRTKIDFGAIVTQTDKTYEVYNAFRSTSVTVTAITNNALPGVLLPNVTPPVVMGPQTSILNPTTTDNSGGTALGTLVLDVVRALSEGLPTFDADIIFVTSQNDPVLLVTGTRNVLVPYEYEVGVKETLSFLTDVIPSLSGHEQRIALRKQPRQSFQVEYALDGLDRQRLQTLLFDWMNNTFVLPILREEVLLTSDVSVGATTYPITGGDDIDMRVGGLAAIITDSSTFDVITVDAFTDTLLTAASASANAYTAGTPIMPVRTVIITNRVNLQRALVTLERFRVSYEVTDNDTGALAGSTTPGFWSTYNSRVLFDDCNVVEGSAMTGSLRRRVHRLDNQTGKFEQSSIWDRNKRSHDKGFFARSRSEIMSLRKLFIALRGRQKAFYIPTFIEELTVNDDLSIGTDTMDIDSISYVRFARDRLPMTIFRITFTDDTSLVRVISSSATVSASTERLTLDTTWPANRTVAEISRIQWYELVRFDSDKMTLTYPSLIQATTKMPVLRVFDDNV